MCSFYCSSLTGFKTPILILNIFKILVIQWWLFAFVRRTVRVCEGVRECTVYLHCWCWMRLCVAAEGSCFLSERIHKCSNTHTDTHTNSNSLYQETTLDWETNNVFQMRDTTLLLTHTLLLCMCECEYTAADSWCLKGSNALSPNWQQHQC